MPLRRGSLSDAQIFLENLVSVAHEAIVVLRGNLQVIEASQAFYRAYDLTRERTIGKCLYDLNEGAWAAPELRQLLEGTVHSVSSIENYELVQQFYDQPPRVLQLNARRFNYQGDPTDMIIVAIRDMTQLKETQAELEAKIHELKERNVALDAFAYMVAHDLKNPVSAIMGFASLIEQYYDRMSREDILENAQAITDSGRNIKNIIDSLLLLANLDRSDTIEIQPLNMHEIIEQVKRTLNHMIRDRGAHIHFPNGWHTALGYAPWVEVIWTNYISNAIKYGGTPPVIRLGSKRLPDSRVLFWVRDNGNGLTHEEQALVFRPFERLAGDEIEGDGLGLALVQKVVDKLGGDVQLESTPGKGCEFGFILPIDS